MKQSSRTLKNTQKGRTASTFGKHLMLSKFFVGFIEEKTQITNNSNFFFK